MSLSYIYFTYIKYSELGKRDKHFPDYLPEFSCDCYVKTEREKTAEQ